MNTLEAIGRRRSIREFRDEAITRETVDKLLEAAVMAPSAKNSQPWRFTVIEQARRGEFLEVIRKGVANRQAEGEEIGLAIRDALGIHRLAR